MGKCNRDGCNGKYLHDTCYQCGHTAEPKLSSKAFPRPHNGGHVGYNIYPDRTYGREYHAVGWFVP